MKRKINTIIRKAMMFMISVIAFGSFNFANVQALTSNETKVFSQYLKTGQSINDIMRRNVIGSGNIANNYFYLRLPTTVQTKSMLNMVSIVNKDLQPIECEPYLCFYRDINKTIELNRLPRDAEFIGDTIRVNALGDIPLGDLYVMVNFNNSHYVNGLGTVQQQDVIGKYCMLHFTCIDSNKTVNSPPMYTFNFMPDIDKLDGRKHSSIDTTKGLGIKTSQGTFTDKTPKPEITIESKPKSGDIDKYKAKNDVSGFVKPSKSIVHDKVPVEESIGYLAKPILNSSKKDLQQLALVLVLLAICGKAVVLRDKGRDSM